MASKQTNEYKTAYNKTAYDRIQLYIPKGERDEIRKQADRLGESLNAFIYRAIVERMQKSAAKQSPAPEGESTEGENTEGDSTKDNPPPTSPEL